MRRHLRHQRCRAALRRRVTFPFLVFELILVIQVKTAVNCHLRRHRSPLPCSQRIHRLSLGVPIDCLMVCSQRRSTLLNTTSRAISMNLAVDDFGRNFVHISSSLIVDQNTRVSGRSYQSQHLISPQGLVASSTPQSPDTFFHSTIQARFKTKILFIASHSLHGFIKDHHGQSQQEVPKIENI